MKKDKSNTQLLSDEELQMLRASQEGEIDRSTLPPHDNSDLAIAKRYAKKNKFSVLFVVLTVILLLAVVGALCFMLFKTISEMPSKDDFTVSLIAGELTEEYTVPYKSAVIDNVFYLDMRQIALFTDLIISGGDGSLKFSTPATDASNITYVRFENGSETATVNGTRVKLEGIAKITETECLVPYTFIEKLFSNPTVNGTPGVRTKFSDKDNTVIIRRVSYESGGFLPISFSADCFDLAEELQMQKHKDLYPNIASACVKMTMLVNKNNPLGSKYAPEGLFSLNTLGCPIVEDRQFELVSNAALSLTAMLDDLEQELGASKKVLVTSAYRSYERQVYLFDRYVQDEIAAGKTEAEAIAEVTRTAARPGQSEHQSGLCVDLIEPGKIELDESFENCAAFKWLSENAHRYGFILRYPKDKIEITGYDYEPWHYRFVGIDAATVIHEDGICLEEYLSQY